MLFNLCEAMKWSHLPSPGGLYQQRAGLLDRFRYIFAAKAEQEKREQAKQKSATSRPSMGGGRKRR